MASTEAIDQKPLLAPASGEGHGPTFSSQALRRRVSFVTTALGFRTRGFYTPYPYYAPADFEVAPYPAIETLFNECRPRFSEFIGEMARLEAAMLATKEGENPLDWTVRFIPPLDGAAIYTGISLFRPNQIIEVGSGTSTHFMMRAVADQGLSTAMTCIDPRPRTEISALPVTFKRRVLREEDTELAQTLDAGDIVFIDSSHILQQGIDCDILMSRIFPVLRKGVIVHLHDIFLPYAYPPAWQPYCYNEQQALIPWLITRYFDPIFASHYAYRDMAGELKAALPNLRVVTPRNGGSIWLRKT